MRILIVGIGKVGHSIAEHLTREKHDVVVIDQNDDVLKKCGEMLDVMCVRGNGANAKALLDAQADHADILIATTGSDESNMLCCLIAKRLGAKYVIARIRDPEYNDSLMLLQRELGIDMVLNPERATALEISRLLRFPFASDIVSFAKGRVELVEFRVLHRDVFVGHALKEITRMRSLPQLLYAAIERDGRVIIPNGNTVIMAGDRVHVVGTMVSITAFFNFLGRKTRDIKHVMLLGGGRISYYLAKMLVPMGIQVNMIEIKENKAYQLSESLPSVNVIHGDGTDQELLDQEGLTDMDAFVTLSDRDEENLMTGLYAARKGVSKVIVKNNRVTYTHLINDLGLETIVSPKSITVANILRYVRGRVNSEGTKVERLYRLMDGKAEALEFIARAGDPYIGIPLKNLKVRPGALVAVIVNKGQVIVPFGNDFIEAGNSVIILTRETGITDLNEVISV